MTAKLLFLIQAALVFQLACFKPEQQASPEKRINIEDFTVKMERTACYGPCPVYNIAIDRSGQVNFEGLYYTEVKGHATAALSPSQLDDLRAEIQRSGFFQFKDSYVDESDCPMIATDNSTVLLSISLNGSQKSIKHDLGCRENSLDVKVYPQELATLEDRIDEIVQTQRWIGKSDSDK